MLFPDYANTYSINKVSSYTAQENCLIYLNVYIVTEDGYPGYVTLNGKRLLDVLSTFTTGRTGGEPLYNIRQALILKKGDTLKTIDQYNSSFGNMTLKIIPLVKLGGGN